MEGGGGEVEEVGEEAEEEEEEEEVKGTAMSQSLRRKISVITTLSTHEARSNSSIRNTVWEGRVVRCVKCGGKREREQL